MAQFERDLLDQSQVVELRDGESGATTVIMTPADAPGVTLGDGRGYDEPEGESGFSWRPTVIVTALVLIVFLAAAFL